MDNGLIFPYLLTLKRGRFDVAIEDGRKCQGLAFGRICYSEIGSKKSRSEATRTKTDTGGRGENPKVLE